MEIEEAKKFFFECNCSSFFMFHTDNVKDEEFQNLNISKNVKEEWAYEYLNKCIDEVLDNTTCRNYIKISDLLLNYHNGIFIKKYTEMLAKIQTSEDFDALLKCKDILGMRNLNIKCGILDYAIECNDTEATMYLIHYVEDCLSNQAPDDNINRMKEKLQEYYQYIQ